LQGIFPLKQRMDTQLFQISRCSGAVCMVGHKDKRLRNAQRS